MHRFGGADVGRVEVERAPPLLCGIAGVAEGPEDLGLFRQRGAADRYLNQVEECHMEVALREPLNRAVALRDLALKTPRETARTSPWSKVLTSSGDEARFFFCIASAIGVVPSLLTSGYLSTASNDYGTFLSPAPTSENSYSTHSGE
jgi:hypothetical protein